MNWLGIIVLAFILFSIINGGRRGLVKTLVSMVTIVLVIILVSILSPHISEILKKETPIYSKVQESCQKQLLKSLAEGGDGNLEEQTKVIEDLPLPQSLKEAIIQRNNEEGYTSFLANNFAEYLSGSLANIILGAISYILSFIIAIILIKIIASILEMIASFPVLNMFNRIGGALLGGVQGVLIVWILLLIITVLCNTSWGAEAFHLIKADPFLQFLYDNNILLKLVQGFLL